MIKKIWNKQSIMRSIDRTKCVLAEQYHDVVIPRQFTVSITAVRRIILRDLYTEYEKDVFDETYR